MYRGPIERDTAFLIYVLNHALNHDSPGRNTKGVGGAGDNHRAVANAQTICVPALYNCERLHKN